MSEEGERQSPAKSGGAEDESFSNMCCLAINSPSGEKHPDFPIEDIFPTDINNMERYQGILRKYTKVLRDLLEKQKEAVKIYAESKGATWDEYVQMRKEQVLAETNLRDPAMNFMENWKDENFLPECHWTIMHIQWIHLCRWTLNKKIELYYKENKDVPRLPVHSKDQIPDLLDAFDTDSASHLEYVRDKQDEEEFLEKTAVLIFNRLGASYLTVRQVRSLERVMEKLLKDHEYKLVQHWTQEVVNMTLEISDQNLADVPSNSSDDPKYNTGANSEDPTIPPTPNPSYASDFENPKDQSNGGTLSRIPPLPKDSSTEEDSSSIDKSEDVGGNVTGELTEDELTSPEDQTNRRKFFTHKSKPNRDEEDVGSTE